jgi:hypothetical protein
VKLLLPSSSPLSYRLLAFGLALVCCIAASAAPVPAAARDKDKEKEHDAKTIDAGSFGIFQKGRRVGTETFSIEQTGYGSLIRSEFKTENGPTTDVQTSEMQLTATGDVRRYEWKELSPGSGQSTVVPNDDFLDQKWTTASGEKEHDQPYLLPTSTSILDDYFFVHREVLVWKFLGKVCKQDKGQLQCPPRQRTQFGTLNPHQQAQSLLTAEFLGREKVTLKNGPQDLLKVELRNDAGTWQLWLDDQFKVQRMSVVGENTEVDRD